jgi:glutamine synthetase
MVELHLARSVLDEIRDSSNQKVKVAVADIDGILRGKYLHKDKLLSATKSGFGFCSVIFGWDCSDTCYERGTIAGLHNGYPDVNAHVDLSTFRRVPWDNNVPFFLADFEGLEGQSIGACSRSLLKRINKKAHAMGYQAKFGAEFEWFNFRESAESLREKAFVNPTPITPGMFGYSILRPSLNQAYFAALSDELPLFGIPIEGLHTETGPGVLEAAILYSDVMEAADRAVLFKTAAKEIAGRFGMIASFMARWSNDLPGCGGHLHQSLWDQNQKNAFFDSKDPLQMSDTFKHYLAGQLQLMPELLLMYAPNVNSYKRLVEGYWAPTTATWGVDNRTTAVRVIKGGEKATRMETRVSGSDINPYLAISAALASGLWGIETKAKLRDAPLAGNAYATSTALPLARNLNQAIEQFEASQTARELFGNDFVEHFALSRAWEAKQFQQQVTTFERARYFEII